MIAEYNSSGTLLRRYVHGPGDDEPVAVYEGAGLGVTGRRYTMPDEHGSVAALVNADGSPSAINRYDSWGIPGAANVGRFQYTGQAWIPELGMYYYKARIYSPTLGRFMQTDPIGYEDDVNLYAYVGNDPVNKTDPTGKCAQCQEEEIAFDQSLSGKSAEEMRTAIMERGQAQGTALLTVGSLLVAPELLIARVGIVAFRMMRVAEVFRPVAAGVSALYQRGAAVVQGINRLAAGEGRIIAGAGARAQFRGAEAAAARYGGKASEYTKVSVSSVTASGDRVSVHAIRNETTGRIYERKVIYGR